MPTAKKVLPLHTYTIVDAINDNNVLPFRIDYVDTVNRKAGIGDKQVKAIDTEKALADPRRVKEIVKYILEHFDQKTKRNGKTYSFRALRNIEAVATDKTRGQVAEVKDSVRLSGFNSIFAVSSIAMAKAYYLEFKRQMQDLPEAKRLRVATIFSYAPTRTWKMQTACWARKIPMIPASLMQARGTFWSLQSRIIMHFLRRIMTPRPTDSRTTIKTFPCA